MYLVYVLLATVGFCWRCAVTNFPTFPLTLLFLGQHQSPTGLAQVVQTPPAGGDWVGLGAVAHNDRLAQTGPLGPLPRPLFWGSCPEKTVQGQP